jgi:hypothetical protein
MDPLLARVPISISVDAPGANTAAIKATAGRSVSSRLQEDGAGWLSMVEMVIG